MGCAAEEREKEDQVLCLQRPAGPARGLAALGSVLIFPFSCWYQIQGFSCHDPIAQDDPRPVQSLPGTDLGTDRSSKLGISPSQEPALGNGFPPSLLLIAKS